MTGILLQTSSEALSPTTKSSKTSKRSIFEMQDSVRNLSEQLPENCETYSTKFYHLGLSSFTPRKLLAPELQKCDPISMSTKSCVPKDPMAMLQLTDEAYEFRKNLSPALNPFRNTPTLSIMKVSSTDTMEIFSTDTIEVSSANTMEASSANTMETSSADTMKAPSSVTSKRLSAGAMKPRTKTQDMIQKEQDNEKHCFSLDLMFVNPNQSTLGTRHVPIPEATKATH